MELAAPGSEPSLRAMACAVMSAARLSRGSELRDLLVKTFDLAQRNLSSPFAVRLAATAGTAAVFAGEVVLARQILAVIVDGRVLTGADDRTRAAVMIFRAFVSDFDGDLEGQVEHFEEAAAAFTRSGDLRGAAMMRANVGYSMALLGLLPEAEARLRDVLALAEQSQLSIVAGTARTTLATVLEWRGRFDAARAMSQLATQSYVTIRDRRMESGARASLALALLRAGDAEGAMTEAQQALALAAPGTEAHAYACAMLAHALLKAVRHAEAMPLAEDAMRVVTVPGSVSSGRQPFMRLVYARARALGKRSQGRGARCPRGRGGADQRRRFPYPHRGRSRQVFGCAMGGGAAAGVGAIAPARLRPPPIGLRVTGLCGDLDRMAKAHSEAFVKLVEIARSVIRECSISDVKSRIDRGDAITLIDVREESEFAAGHLPGAVHIGRGVLERDVEGAFPDPARELVLYCGGGFRSALAAESLGKMGYADAVSMDGGVRAWREAGYPMVKPA